MNVRELCRLLSATLHLPGVDRWAEQLVSRELLPSLDREVYALDAALLLMAVVAAPRPEDAPLAVITLADLPLVRRSGRRPADGRKPFPGTTLPAGHFGARKAAETRDFLGPLWHMQDIAP